MYTPLQTRPSSARRLACGSVLLGLTLLGIGCQSANSKSERAFESGERYLAQQKFAEADIEFQKSVQQNLQAWEPRYYLAKTELKLGIWEEAHRNLIDVIERNPQFVPARLDLAELLLAGNQPRDAEAQLDEVQALEPNNPRAQAVRAGLSIVQQDFSRAIDECERAKQLAPNQAIIWTECGFARVSAKQYGGAETDFRRALELNPNSPENYRNLSSLLRQVNREKEVDPLLQQAVHSHPKSLDFAFLLADSYVRERRLNDVEQLFAALKARADEFPDLQVQLGDFWIWRNELSRAVGELEAAQARQPSLSVEKKLASAYLSLNRIADADRLTQMILKADKRDAEGRTFDGALTYLRGDFPTAIEKLQSVLKEEPDSLLANYYLGLSWAASKQPEKAKASFNDCIRVNSEFVHAYGKLAELSIQTKDGRIAEEYARRAIRVNPGFVDAYLLLAQAQMQVGNLTEASATLDAIQKLPTIPAEFHEVAAQYYTLKGDESLARKQYDQAAAASAQPFIVLVRFSSFEADHGHIASAIKVVKEASEKDQSQPAYYDVLANLYMRNHDLVNAETDCRKSLELAPQNWSAHLLLGSILQQRGREQDALAQYAEATRLDSHQITSRLLAGNLLMNRGEYDKAKPLFEEALREDPNSLPAQTSLARWYGDQGQNLDVALAMAQQVKNSLPNDRTVSDTLGWIYYQKGAYKFALQQLQPAATALPENALVQYHLGMTYLQLGDKEKGQRTLQRALKLGLRPSTRAADVEDQLKKLRYETTSATLTSTLPFVEKYRPLVTIRGDTSDD